MKQLLINWKSEMETSFNDFKQGRTINAQDLIKVD